MVHLAVSSNLAGERGRRVKGGDRESHTGITEKVLTTLNNQKLRGDSIKGIRKKNQFYTLLLHWTPPNSNDVHNNNDGAGEGNAKKA